MRRRGARALAAALRGDAARRVRFVEATRPRRARIRPMGAIAVVTSTNVWGDVVREVGGDHVAVTPVITDPAADPHSFEPNAQAQLAVSKAQLVVRERRWLRRLDDADGAGSGSIAPVINVVALRRTQTSPP